MGKISRIAAVFAAAAFLITALVPVSSLAANPAPEYKIEATAGPDNTPLVPGAQSGYTQVAVGTPVKLSASAATSVPPPESSTDPGSGGEGGSSRKAASASRAATNYAWSASPTAAQDSMPETTTGAALDSITVTPSAASGAQPFVYTVEVTDSSAADGTAKASFSLTVVNQLTAQPVSGVKAGDTVQLKAQWGNGSNTVLPGGMTYQWKAVTEGAPALPDGANGSSPQVSVQVPGTTPNNTTYTYSVTPVCQEFVYTPTEISFTVSNTFAAETNAPVTWYVGDETLPSLTARFTAKLQSAAWQTGSTWTADASPVFEDNNPDGTSSTYTLSQTDAAALQAGAKQTYSCQGTSEAGSIAVGQVTLNVADPTPPTVSGSAAATGSGAISTKPYATGTGTCTLNAVAAGPPVLAVEATGGKGGVLGTSSAGSGSTSGSGSESGTYTYTWYQTGSNYSTAGIAALGETSSSLTLQPSGEAGSLAAAGQTAYFVCEVGISGNNSPKSVGTQKFAVTTLEQPNLAQNADVTSNIKPTQPVNTELSPALTLAVQWDPPVLPNDVSQYQWTVTKAPSGGQITLQSANSATPAAQDGYMTTGMTEPSIQVTKFSTAGTYVVTCQPQTTAPARATYPPVSFEMVAGAPSLPSDLVTYYATQSSGGTIPLSPAGQVQNSTVSVDVNSRLALYVPDASGAAEATGYVTEWLVRRTPSESPESVPTGAGFYGVNDYTLVTGPVTTQMNGWQFCIRVSAASAPNDPALSAQSPWITMRVNGSAPSTTPQVTLTSSPAAQSGSVPVAAGGNVTFTATVSNANSIPASNLTYQWYTQGTTASAIAQTVSGATSPTYTISNVDASQNGQSYWCVVSNSGHMNEQGTSPRLTLNVSSQPGAVVISEPTGPSLTNLSTGNPVTFVAEARTTDGSAVTYQWYMRRSPTQIQAGTAVTTIAQAQQYIGSAVSSLVPDAVSPTLTVPSLAAGVYEYTCRVSNSANNALFQYTAPYYVAVTQRNTKPVIMEPTQAITYVGGKAGDAMYLPCDAYLPADNTPTYQWQTAPSGSGPWSDLGGYTASELRIPSLTDQNNGAYYRCMVTNPDTNEQTASGAYQVSVWSPNDTPTVTGNPQSVSYTISLDNSTQPADNTIPLESTATSSNTSGLYAQWQYRPSGGSWTNVPDAAYGSSISGPATSNGTSRLTLAANGTSQAPSGEYRCVWMVGTQAPNQPLIPQSSSLPAVVQVIVPGNPHITTQPTGAAVHVGSTASFTVGADLGQQGTLVYVWQTSSDRGQTWRNCTSAMDGTGQFTSTFRTYPVTQQMYETLAAASPGNLVDSIYQYRCIVANRTRSLDVVSDAVPLAILPGTENTPAITPGTGSTIQIVGSGGAKYTKGLQLTANGTTESSFLNSLNYTAPAGYNLQILNRDGQEVPSSALICTGMRMVLVHTVTGETVDTVSIVMMGDVLGEGKMTLSQLVAMAKAFRGNDNLSGAYYQAALWTGKDTVQLSDLVAEATLYKQFTNPPAPASSSSAEPSASASPSSSPSAEPTPSASPSGAR